MKARVKSIGEISTLEKRYGSEPDQTGKNEYLKDSNLNINFDIDIDSTPNIDWEQRRYELAKSAMNSLLCSSSWQKVREDGFLPSRLADDAIMYADELIRQLKNK